MDEKRSSSRSKRQKPIDEGCWDCSVCTFKNPPEAYKCEMCDVRKGTSTRKPRLNAQIAAQQVAQQYVPPPPKKEKESPRLDSNGLPSLNHNESSSDSFDSQMNSVIETNSNIVKKEKNHTNSSKRNSRSPRLKDIDRSSATHMAVTVGSVTVVITDYKPKKERRTSTETHSNVVSDSSDTSSHGLLNNHDDEVMMDNGNQ